MYLLQNARFSSFDSFHLRHRCGQTPAIAQLDFGKQHYIDVVDMDDMDMHGISVGVGVGVVAGVAVGMLDGYG